MPPFEIEHQASYGRIGHLQTDWKTIQTPALYPVINLIGGTTIESGGIWKFIRDEMLAESEAPAVMMQAMGFTDYGVGPENLNNFWRAKEGGLHGHFETLDCPLFVDSGGFTLMNSNEFGEDPSHGGDENPWGIYTNAESILDLQLDFGADIIATLDFPIPPDLKENEKVDRMERSIDSAVETLELLDKRDANPLVYVAIHGHDYEDINWYVGQFFERAEEYVNDIEGFAIGSLVPLRNQVDILVDIVQGARDAIPESRLDETSLHVFGVSGPVIPLLALLGADSFDSATYQREAQYRKFVHPETRKRIAATELDTNWPCDCDVCQNLDIDQMQRVLGAEESYTKIDGYWKSEFYAKIARHNFAIYQREIDSIHTAIRNDELLDYIAEEYEYRREQGFHSKPLETGIKQAQLRDPVLRADLEDRGYTQLVAGPETKTFQSNLTAFGDGTDPTERSQRTISLKHGPSDFNVLRTDYTPAEDETCLLILPCSQQKPYSESKTQRTILDKIDHINEHVHKISLSGLYGPVPERFEERQEILEYEYVLTPRESKQIELVTDRMIEYLEKYGNSFDTITGYTTNKAYRSVLESAFQAYGRGNIFPTNPKALQLTEHFRNKNIQQLVDYLEDAVQTSVSQ